MKLFSALFAFMQVMLALGQAPEDLFDEARAHFDENRFREALALMDRCIKADSLNPEAYKIRGNCNLQINQLEKALADYQTAIRIDPSYSDAYFNAGNVLEQLGKVDSAQTYFTTFTALEPSDPDGYLRLALNAMTLGKGSTVLALFEKAYTLDTTNVMSIGWLMRQYFDEGEFDKVILLAGNGKKIDPFNVEFLLFGAVSELRSGDAEQAILQLDSALTLDSLNFDARHLMMEAQVTKRTDQGEVYLDENHRLKFTNFTSTNVNAILKKDGPGDFDSLKARLRNEILGLDSYFRFYLAQGTQKTTFQPYFQKSNPRISELFQGGKFTELAPFANEIFEQNPLMLDDLYAVAVANYMIRDFPTFERLYSVYVGIMESILATGTGVDQERAYIVVSPHDEYSVLSYLGLHSSSQALLFGNGHRYDKLTAQDESGGTHDVYFNIDIPFDFLGDSFSPPAEKRTRKRKRE